MCPGVDFAPLSGNETLILLTTRTLLINMGPTKKACPPPPRRVSVVTSIDLSRARRPIRFDLSSLLSNSPPLDKKRDAPKHNKEREPPTSLDATKLGRSSIDKDDDYCEEVARAFSQ